MTQYRAAVYPAALIQLQENKIHDFSYQLVF